MEYQKLFLNRKHWLVGEIPYAPIAWKQLNRNRQLFDLAGSADPEGTNLKRKI
jgi:hypothetical protein